MTHIKTQKLLRPTKDLGGRIFTTVLLFRRKKEKKINAFSWAKNTARGVRFLLGFNMYLFFGSMRTGIPVFDTCPPKNSNKTPNDLSPRVVRSKYGTSKYM